MAERKIIQYYPRNFFGKFLGKRQVEYVSIETDDKVSTENFYENGALRREYVRWKTAHGPEKLHEVEKLYFLNGQRKSEMVITEDEERYIRWDENGTIRLNSKIDKKTQTETRYHSNGQLKIRHNRKTGEYEEWRENGDLKKKGFWVMDSGRPADSLDNPYAWFQTGNMRRKFEDEQRQEFNEVIDLINILPITQGRKVAKEALAKAYRETLARTKD